MGCSFSHPSKGRTAKDHISVLIKSLTSTPLILMETRERNSDQNSTLGKKLKRYLYRNSNCEVQYEIPKEPVTY